MSIFDDCTQGEMDKAMWYVDVVHEAGLTDEEYFTWQMCLGVSKNKLHKKTISTLKDAERKIKESANRKRNSK